MSGRSARLLLITIPVVVLAVVASLGYVVVARATRQAGSYSSPRPDLGTAPTYTLTNQNGARVSSTAFAGKVQVVTYLFPYCTTFCPTITHTLKQLEGDLRDEGLLGRSVEVVTFNVDPTNAGPPQMREYLRQYGVDPHDPAWQFLTGSRAAVEHVVRDGFHVYYSKISDAAEAKQIAREKRQGLYTKVPQQPNPLAERRRVGYDVVHNDYVEVVGKDGHVRLIYSEGNTVSEAKLFAAVRALAVGS